MEALRLPLLQRNQRDFQFRSVQQAFSGISVSLLTLPPCLR